MSATSSSRFRVACVGQAFGPEAQELISEVAPAEFELSFDMDTTEKAHPLTRESDFVPGEVIRPLDNPVQPGGGLIGLFSSLAPNGAVLKRAAADERLCETTASAVVFDGREEAADAGASGAGSISASSTFSRPMTAATLISSQQRGG